MRKQLENWTAVDVHVMIVGLLVLLLIITLELHPNLSSENSQIVPAHDVVFKDRRLTLQSSKLACKFRFLFFLDKNLSFFNL